MKKRRLRAGEGEKGTQAQSLPENGNLAERDLTLALSPRQSPLFSPGHFAVGWCEGVMMGHS